MVVQSPEGFHHFVGGTIEHLFQRRALIAHRGRHPAAIPREFLSSENCWLDDKPFGEFTTDSFHAVGTVGAHCESERQYQTGVTDLPQPQKQLFFVSFRR